MCGAFSACSSQAFALFFLFVKGLGNKNDHGETESALRIVDEILENMVPKRSNKLAKFGLNKREPAMIIICMGILALGLVLVSIPEGGARGGV